MKSSAAHPLIRMEAVSKSYGGAARALDGVSLEIWPGEIRALCGENGAGKSTLIKILAGILSHDEGRVMVSGEALPANVRAAEGAGIAVIHQESVAFPHLSAVDNIFVGRELRRFGGMLLDRRAMLEQTVQLLARLGELINPLVPVGELPLAQRQMVGMARALSHRCRLLIMDEPTASLSQRETATLFRIIRQLQSEGVAILYVSHRMEEIFLLSDRVTVLRDGRHVATKTTRDTNKEEVIKLMVGRELLQVEGAVEAQGEAAGGEPLLEVRGLTRERAFADVSFAVRAGEIVGMAGLVGAGRSEVARVIFGVDVADAGFVRVGDKKLKAGSIRAAMRAGVALVPEDRQHEGLILPMSGRANLSMAVLSRLTTLGLISRRKENAVARQMIGDLRVKIAGPGALALSLSGGNQQKLVIGKWLATRPRVLMLDEPTRGVDVGAKAEIYRLIRDLTRQGMAIVLISSDLPEVLLLADRILVMRAGRIAGELAREQATQEMVLALAMPDAAAQAAGGRP